MGDSEARLCPAFSTSSPKASFKSRVEAAFRINPDLWVARLKSPRWTRHLGRPFSGRSSPAHGFLGRVLDQCAWNVVLVVENHMDILHPVVIGVYIEKGFVNPESIKGSLYI